MAFSKKQKGYLITLVIINVILLVFHFIPVSDDSTQPVQRGSILEGGGIEQTARRQETVIPEKEEKPQRTISKVDDKISIEYEPIQVLTEEERTAMLDSWRININEASVEELVALPRVGPAFAQRIVDYREENGPFVTEADVLKVSGVGPAVMKGIRDLIHYGEIDPQLLRERQAETRTGKININLATAEELTEIKGVGPATAKRIIQYREENQRFRTVDDLLNVSGIGPATLKRMRDQVTVTEAGLTKEAVRRQETVTQPKSTSTKRRTSPSRTRSTGAIGPDGKININKASADELTQLRGIGPASAKRIIEHRNSIRSFRSIEQIKDVSGIGDATFERIKDKISIR
jgi:competence protein ComEA